MPGEAINVTCPNSNLEKSLDVTWFEPSDPNGIIGGYNVFWQKFMNKNVKQREEGIESFKFTEDININIDFLGKYGNIVSFM